MMKSVSEPRILLWAVSSALLLRLLSLPGIQAQSSPPVIQPLFTFGCDSKTHVCPNGENPNWLMQSADGNFYGTTNIGGVESHSGGTVFKITPQGALSVVYTFEPDAQGNFPNGWFPDSLVEGNDGFLYGATLGGGVAGAGATVGGVIFKLSKAGMIQVLHNVCTSCSEGAEPANLILASDGNFYGTAEDVLFRVTPAGAYTVMLTSTANQPPRGVVQASDGNLYGTTIGGRTIPTPFFRITRAGQFTTLHTFSYPDFASNIPIQGADGKLYGNSTAGLFVSNLSGSEFQEFSISGYAGLSIIQASDLNLWSAVFSEQNAVNGVIHQISTKGSLLQTIAFDGTNGNGPNGPLVQGSDGKIYGVTNTGGSAQSGEVASGVVFTLDAGLAPPKPGIVSFSPSSGAAGAKVMIHGSHFVGTKAVTFNGVSTSFQVLNTGNIVATVPAGATTGPLAVTNAGGTVKSSRSFTVQ